MIIAPVPEVRVEAVGLRQAIEAGVKDLLERYKTVTFAVVAAAGKRSAALNTLIARVQQGMERDPFYVSDTTMKAILAVVWDLFSADAGRRRRAQERIEALVVGGVIENIAHQENPPGRGRFRPVTPAYAAWKRRRGWGNTILVASTELVRSLKAKVYRDP